MRTDEETVTVRPGARITRVPRMREALMVRSLLEEEMTYTPSELRPPPRGLEAGVSRTFCMAPPGTLIGVPRDWYIAMTPLGGIALLGEAMVTPPLATPNPVLARHCAEPVSAASRRR